MKEARFGNLSQGMRFDVICKLMDSNLLVGWEGRFVYYSELGSTKGRVKVLVDGSVEVKMGGKHGLISNG